MGHIDLPWLAKLLSETYLMTKNNIFFVDVGNNRVVIVNKEGEQTILIPRKLIRIAEESFFQKKTILEKLEASPMTRDLYRFNIVLERVCSC